jgi:hypothetical protein
VFTVTRSDDLTGPLKRSERDVSVKVDGADVTHLNTAIIFIRNGGNAPIEDVEFDVFLKGSHDFVAAEAGSDTTHLKASIVTKWGKKPEGRTLNVKVPFINAREAFGLRFLFDGDTQDCEVECRMAGVKTVVRKLPHSTTFGPEVADALLQIYPFMKWLLRVLPRRTSS